MCEPIATTEIGHKYYFNMVSLAESCRHCKFVIENLNGCNGILLSDSGAIITN